MEFNYLEFNFSQYPQYFVINITIKTVSEKVELPEILSRKKEKENENKKENKRGVGERVSFFLTPSKSETESKKSSRN